MQDKKKLKNIFINFQTNWKKHVTANTTTQKAEFSATKKVLCLMKILYF